MHRQATFLFGLLLAGLPFLGSRNAAASQDSKLERLKYNHPGLVVDLGAGLWAWPLPMDVNGDGRMDMVGGGSFVGEPVTCKPRHPKVRRMHGSHHPTPQRLIEMLDDAGIDTAVVLPLASPECRYTPVIPEEALEICAEYPKRLIPFCNFDPRYFTNSSKANFRPLCVVSDLTLSPLFAGPLA